MGKILSSFLGFILCKSKKEKDPDLEERLTQTEYALTAFSLFIKQLQADDGGDGGGGGGGGGGDDDGGGGDDGGEDVFREQELASELEIEEVVVESSNNDVESQVSVDVCNQKEEIICIRWMKHYNNGQKILLVGEGDFSFSSALATAFISAPNIIATSLDSLEFLGKNYRNAISNIRNLQTRGSIVMHQVDVAEMENHQLLKDLKFDRIIYNFPLAGFFKDESRQSQLRRNQMLVVKFMDNARMMLHKNGEIHITHKCNNGFFRNWNLERLGSESGIRLLEEIPFQFNDYPGYSTKYGFGGDNSFNCNPSKTYKFGLKN